MLEVAGLNVRYGKSHVVFDLDLSLDGGEVLALLGRNGAGKTTTILGILGLLSGASGSAPERRCRGGAARPRRSGLAAVQRVYGCFGAQRALPRARHGDLLA